MTDLRVGWFKSSRSKDNADCVEVRLDEAEVGVRDTKDRLGGQLSVPASAWRALVTTMLEA